MNYCESYTHYARYKTIEVKIGLLTIGGNRPICIQSMTTQDTMNIEGTVNECLRLIKAGCELIRITCPSMKEAEKLKEIKQKLRDNGFKTPLVADIHYTPNAAELAAKIVEKVRINPGNYLDKKKFQSFTYTKDSYQQELFKIEDKLAPLIEICKTHTTALRIGVNHGSLSDRILSRFGDTPQGMVESALEFTRICEKHGFRNIVLSMKASNPVTMVHAYRLLAATMLKEKIQYPIHLGVTEAGDGEDGRIKSAIGIGTLLEDGIGDTIRVSLTESPEKEIPVAKILAKRYKENTETLQEINYTPIFSPYNYEKRKSTAIKNIGGKNVPIVVADLSNLRKITPANLYAYGYHYSIPNDKWTIKDTAVDYLYIGNNSIDFELPGILNVLQDEECWKQKSIGRRNHFPCLKSTQIKYPENKTITLFIEINIDDYHEFNDLKNLNPNCVLILKTTQNKPYKQLRKFMFGMAKHRIDLPVIFNCHYTKQESEEEFLLYSAIDNGALFIDGFGDGIMLSAPHVQHKLINRTAFGILQASRVRTFKTEYISCPSCGRTLFDLEEVTQKVRAKTNHLKGLKIAIMGCIVNGPGEMADADYGYVGAGQGKITLYKEKTIVKRNVDEKNAVDELINIIKENGDWQESN
jgi:(E)-4-hydroxy-3-methylbut-2-enyl-diphosphate synthase